MLCLFWGKVPLDDALAIGNRAADYRAGDNLLVQNDGGELVDIATGKVGKDLAALIGELKGDHELAGLFVALHPSRLEVGTGEDSGIDPIRDNRSAWEGLFCCLLRGSDHTSGRFDL